MMAVQPTVLSFLLVVWVAHGVLAQVPGDTPPAPVAPAELPALTVVSTPLGAPTAAAAGAVNSVADALSALPGIEVKSQGLASGQTDLQIRGSSFSGAGLSVGGLALHNPQTEHFNAELPVSPLLFSPPAVLTGLAQAEATDGHLVGAVSYDFLPIENRGALETGLGEDGHDWQSFLVQTPLVRNPPKTELGVSVFGSRENADSTDGYFDNFLDRWNGGAHLQLRTPQSQTDLLAAESWKRFGARGFYGAPASLPSQEELDDQLLLGSSRWGSLDENYVRLTGAWRQLVDRYQLDRNHPELYENLHRSTELAVNLDGAQGLTEALRLHWRLEAAEETLHSSYSGTIPSTGLGDHRRDRAGLTLIPEWRVGDLYLSLGGRAEFFSGDKPAWLPLAGIRYEVMPGQTLYADYVETVRQPSFTELNYDSPGSLGNQGLERQHDRALELGWRGAYGASADWRVAAFCNQSENAVDWIKTSAASRWLATNLDTVTTTGIKLEGGYHPARDWGVNLGYALLHKKCDEEVYASRYVLDYPQQRVTLGGYWRPVTFCELRIQQAFQYQTSNAVRASGRTAWPVRAEARFMLNRRLNTTLVLACENGWADDFETFPGQPVAGRRVSAALQLTW